MTAGASGRKTQMKANQPGEEKKMPSAEVKHPEVTVRLVGEDGNAFAIMGRVTQALRRAGVSDDEIKAYTDEATSGDYDNLLRTTMRWVDVE